MKQKSAVKTDLQYTVLKPHCPIINKNKDLTQISGFPICVRFSFFYKHISYFFDLYCAQLFINLRAVSVFE